MTKCVDNSMYVYLESEAELAKDDASRETISTMMERQRSNDDFIGQADTSDILSKAIGPMGDSDANHITDLIQSSE